MIATLMLAIFLFLPRFIFAGDEPAYGGDSYAAEFISTAKTALEHLKGLPPEEIAPVEATKLEETISRTQVSSEETLLLNGNEVDAINYPESGKIQISRSRWRNLRGESEAAARFNLVLHEYLSVSKIEDSQYRVSQKLMKAMHLELLARIWKDENKSIEKSNNFSAAMEMGMANYTGGLGKTNSTAFYKGLKVSYNAKPSVSLDFSAHQGISRDTLGIQTQMDISLVPLLMGIRYQYVKADSKFFDVVRPYAALGGGLYIRKMSVVASDSEFEFNDMETTTHQPGFYAGIGAKLQIIHQLLNLGLDFTYHKIFFPDADETYGGKVADGDRSGGYIASVVNIGVSL